MSAFLRPFLPYIIGVLALASVLWGIHHQGYKSGQAERTAHYQPILTAIDRERLAAEGRVKAAQAASAALTAEQEQRYALHLQAIQNRATRAEQRMVSFLQDGSSRCRDRVPEVAGASPKPEPAPEELERNRRLGGRIAGVGAGCEGDAAAVLDLQRFYNAQRALLER